LDHVYEVRFCSSDPKDSAKGGTDGKESKPALINTTSASSKIMHPNEDISLVSILVLFLVEKRALSKVGKRVSFLLFSPS